MGLRELRECFEEFSYTSNSATQALKKIAERLRQMAIDEQSVEYEHTLVGAYGNKQRRSYVVK